MVTGIIRWSRWHHHQPGIEQTSSVPCVVVGVLVNEKPNLL